MQHDFVKSSLMAKQVLWYTPTSGRDLGLLQVEGGF